MAWTPPTPSAALGVLVNQAGLAANTTYAVWSTEGLLQSPNPGGGEYYAVLRFEQRPITDRVKSTNGNGLTTLDMMFIDGVQWNITVREDRRMTPPQLFSSITIVDVAGLVPNGARGAIYAARLIDPSYSGAPKQPGERVMTVERLRMIDTGAGV